MNEEEFFQAHVAEWTRLQNLTALAEKSLKKLSKLERLEFLKLYRSCSTDLATARTHGASQAMVISLNQLLCRTYAVIYRRPSKTLGELVYDSLAAIANSVRRQSRFVWIASALFLVFTLWTGWLTAHNPDVKAVLLPPGMSANADAWIHGLPDRDASESAMMTGFYSANNGFLALIGPSLATGTFGVYAIISLFQNAANMGALACLMTQAGKLHVLILMILPHGVPELSGFMISTGGGLAMGWALINPGRKSRARALSDVGGDVILMTVAGILLTFLAAPIEGWFSYSSAIPLAAKGAFGAVEIVAWGLFWYGFGRKPRKSSGPKSLSKLP